MNHNICIEIKRERAKLVEMLKEKLLVFKIIPFPSVWDPSCKCLIDLKYKGDVHEFLHLFNPALFTVFCSRKCNTDTITPVARQLCAQQDIQNYYSTHCHDAHNGLLSVIHVHNRYPAVYVVCHIWKCTREDSSDIIGKRCWVWEDFMNIFVLLFCDSNFINLIIIPLNLVEYRLTLASYM